jgi:hypothetical protein
MIPMVRAAGILALTVALAAGCGGTTPPSQSPVGSAAAAASGAPAGFASAGAPAGASSPGALPSSAPSSAGSSAVPSASQGPLDSGTATGASACSGSHDNRVFFEAIAGQVTWAVYCAVLPAGWFVQTGSFSLRDGGHMDITYKGPNGALLTLDEGAVCAQGAGGCTPQGQQLGTSAFGDRSGTLTALGSGDGYAIYVDPGAFPSWSVTGTGLDQATFAGLAAALYHVQG